MTYLVHEYDPVKRREYYLRTRKLKGRKKGVAKPVKPKKTAAERRRELELRAARLQAKLEHLQALLKTLVAAAKKRSGVEDVQSKYETPTRSDPTNKYQKKTASQKAAAAKASRKYYEENKDDILAKIEDLSNKIKSIQARIKRLRSTSSVGAGNSNTT